MTREEWLIEKVNTISQNHIVPKILEHKDELQKDEQKANPLTLTAFMYTIGRISPLRYLMTMARALTEEEFHKVDIELAREANESCIWNEKLEEVPSALPQQDQAG